MVTKKYDYVFITHLPAFYKINLYNKLAKQLTILVVFIADSSTIRTSDFVQKTNYNFDHIIINQEPFEIRSQWKSSLKFMRLLSQLKFKKIIVGGWDLLEFWLAWVITPKAKLAVAIESSIHESQTTGLKSWLKKIFISKISTAYVSGRFQQKLVERLGFTKLCIVTGGVGLIHPPKIPNMSKKFRGRFLYLGRLSPEKNIDLLLKAFSQDLSQYHLTIVGKGPLDSLINIEIKNKNINNITLQSHVPNSEISALFDSHDVLVLPSQQEPWGLVVEEAIAHGLPVIASDKVGCHAELIKHQVNGYMFNNNIEQFTEACHWVALNYAMLVDNIANNAEFDWRNREQNQLVAYIDRI